MVLGRPLFMCVTKVFWKNLGFISINFATFMLPMLHPGIIILQCYLSLQEKY
ncbi:hypothetical protein AHAS_Ahas11G0175600 [Arachis hypogaea]